MCGFAGYSSCVLDRRINVSVLNAMQETLVHRGPDGKGVWISPDYSIGFVHRRLSLIDVSDAGLQPMTTADGNVTLIFNGEIYNHQELRTELESLGYTYRSSSDSETLLYALNAWGIACLKKLEGEFAFVFFDARTNELYCVRDRMGVKPLYFSEKKGWFSFASEIKALWCLPWLEKKVSARALYHYLTFMVTPAPLTLYEDVYKLPAGYYAKLDSKRNLTFHEWYNPLSSFSHDEYQRAHDESYCIEKIQTLLRNSVHARLNADVPLGVLLSGGVDSSAITALMAEKTSNIKTFTIAFSDGPEYSELEWARIVSKQYGTQHHEIVISEKEAFSVFNTMAYYQDEPIADCVCIPLYYVSKLAHDHEVRALLVGEGSDELFCGYPTYARFLSLEPSWRRSTNYIPGWVRRKMYCWAQFTPFKRKERMNMLYDWAYDRSFFWSGALAFSEHFKRRLYATTPAFMQDPMLEKMYTGINQSEDSYTFIEYHLKKMKHLIPHADFLLKMIYLELKQRLPELLLMRVDKMTMAHSIESRVPFLDYRLVEFALNIPTHLKYKNGETKYILKKALEGIVPSDILYRKKMGFAAPTTRWFHNSSPLFGKQIKEDINSEALKNSHLRPSVIFDLYQKHIQHKADYPVQLWTLKNFIAAVSYERQ